MRFFAKFTLEQSEGLRMTYPFVIYETEVAKDLSFKYEILHGACPRVKRRVQNDNKKPRNDH